MNERFLHDDMREYIFSRFRLSKCFLFKVFFSSFPMIGFFLQEFELLFYNLSSARIFFRMDENEDEEEDDLKSVLG